MLTKKKVSEMPVVGNINNFQVFGWDTANGSARASMSQLKGNVGATPNITIRMNAISYGSIPTVGKTGTAENPTFTIGFPLAKNGEKPLFQKVGDYIQYKYESDSTWVNLISLNELRFHYSDLTSDQIKELQKPALDAVENVEIAIQNAESATNAANQATTNANNAADAANAAKDSANAAAQAATEATSEVNTAIQNSEAATNAANTAASETNDAKEAANTAADRANEISDNPPRIGDNGNWWVWDENTDLYEDTGKPSKGDVMYATFEINPLTGILTMTTPDNYNGPTFNLQGNNLTVTI